MSVANLKWFVTVCRMRLTSWNPCMNIYQHYISTPAQRSPARAFTLIELLVSISIIGLLVAIILPALGSSRDAARDVICATRIKQMGLATHLYHQDNRDYFFPFLQDQPTGRLWWFGFETTASQSLPEGSRILDRTLSHLWRYYQATDTVEICPAYPLQSPKYKPKYTTNWTTYGVARNLTDPTDLVRTPRIREPSRTLLFADASQRNTFQAPASPLNPMFEQWYYVTPSERTTLFHHQLSANAVMQDGSVRDIKPNGPVLTTFVEAPIGFPPADLLYHAP